MPLLIYSLADPAGVNIAQNLVERFGFREHGSEPKTYENGELELVGVEGELIALEGVDKRFKSDLFIFLSRHRSKSELKCFTAHIPGNWGKAELGGEEKKVSFSFPSKLKTILKEMAALAKEKIGWPVYLEADHHGPLTKTPSIFVEIGSSEGEWVNKTAGGVVAEAVMKSVASREKFEVAFCVGGGHYAPAFTKVVLESGTAVSHVLQKYYIDEVDFETFKQGVYNSVEKADSVMLDWKGMRKEQREKAMKFAGMLGLECKRA